MFQGRKLVIATKHKKEEVIAPIIEKELGVLCVLPTDFDTDQFGTFSGEIERKYDSLTTAKNKCKFAMEKTGCDLAIASEGSFGPHPTLYFVPADHEVLYFMDTKNSIEVYASEISIETNFAGKEIESLDELQEFASTMKFPSHGLILKATNEDSTLTKKGIQDHESLKFHFQELKKVSKTIAVETDMRACYNPTRMKVIGAATNKLISILNSKCPACHFPGFEITEYVKGLPCELCQLPTKGIKKHIYICKKCNHSIEQKYPNNQRFQEARFCDFCNP